MKQSQSVPEQKTITQCYLDMFQTYDDIVTPDDVASMLHLPLKRIYRMLRAGELKSVKVERSYRIAKLWVSEYVQAVGFQRQESFAAQRKSAVCVYCQQPRSRRQIQEFLDLSDKKWFMDTVLRPLVEDGTLRMTMPEYPAHIKQRYVATQSLPYKQEDLDE